MSCCVSMLYDGYHRFVVLVFFFVKQKTAYELRISDWSSDVCSSDLVSCTWELGLLHLIGFGLDPFAMLVPFLIMAVSVSHGVQYVNSWAHEISTRNAT